VYIATNFLKFIPIPILNIYKLPIKIVSLFIFVISIFITGITYNESNWQKKLQIEQQKYELAKKEQEILNIRLGEEIAARLANVKNTSLQLKQQNNAFTKTIKSKDATIQNIISALDETSKAKYNALSALEKIKIDKQIQEAIIFEKDCSVVPEIYINRLNDSAQNYSIKK
jgi:hypothetical protein